MSDVSNDREYVFEMWATTRPNDSYYYTNWNYKKKVEVVAKDQKEAFSLAEKILEHAGRHRHWVFKTIGIKDIRINNFENSQEKHTL